MNKLNGAMIGGIPAHEWVGRQVRVMGFEGKQHGMPALLVSIEKDRAYVKPAGHKREEKVALSSLNPSWKGSPDFKERVDALVTLEIEDDDETTQQAIREFARESAISAVAVIPAVAAPVAEEPTPPPVVVSLPVIRQPRMVVHDHSADWLPTYQKYIGALHAEASTKQLLEEVKAELVHHCGEQSRLVAELRVMGVEIIDIEAECLGTDPVETKPTKPAKPATTTLTRPNKRMGRVAMDKFLLTWGKQVRARLEAGEVVTGTIGGWTTELHINWIALGARLDLLSSLLKLQFVDTQGRTGNAARGDLTVTLQPK